MQFKQTLKGSGEFHYETSTFQGTKTRHYKRFLGSSVPVLSKDIKMGLTADLQAATNRRLKMINDEGNILNNKNSSNEV